MHLKDELSELLSPFLQYLSFPDPSETPSLLIDFDKEVLNLEFESQSRLFVPSESSSFLD